MKNLIRYPGQSDSKGGVSVAQLNRVLAETGLGRSIFQTSHHRDPLLLVSPTFQGTQSIRCSWICMTHYFFCLNPSLAKLSLFMQPLWCRHLTWRVWSSYLGRAIQNWPDRNVYLLRPQCWKLRTFLRTYQNPPQLLC